MSPVKAIWPRRAVQLFVGLLLLNFTAVGSFIISPLLPILRFPKLVEWGAYAQTTSVPICAIGSSSRVFTAVYPLLILLAVAAVVLLVGAGIGRALCGWLCPMGFLQDIVTDVKKRAGIKAVDVPPRAHDLLSNLKYAYLFLISALVASVAAAELAGPATSGLYDSYLSGMMQTSPFCEVCPTPVTRYGLVDIGVNLNPNLADVYSYFKLATLLIFLFGMAAVPRFWCRYLCPMGALTSLFNKVSLAHIYKDVDKCTKCMYCVRACPKGVRAVGAATRSEIRDTGCTLCLQCVDACPEDALRLRVGGRELYAGEKRWFSRGAGARVLAPPHSGSVTRGGAPGPGGAGGASTGASAGDRPPHSPEGSAPADAIETRDAPNQPSSGVDGPQGGER